ncbi:ABC transporter substrate-binding protein [Curtobacterium sp. PhB136]|uniref:heme/hemin ABC transporter substrate-binding protein n=1 Tax=Curtobacterium sp. PhB136 TaxID=2485181 RepID=UPI00104D8535|nr:ABC transporter substrate-binding protein [Curtobacterium sp. PhB136]
MRRSPFVVALPIVLVAALVGCSGGGEATSVASGSAAAEQPISALRPKTDAVDLIGPSTARLERDDVEPLVEPGGAQLPATVTSHDLGGDSEQTVTHTDRVLALDVSGSLAATVVGLGLGDHLVGRDVSSTFSSVRKLPVVTQDGHSINAEAVLSLEPDVVLTDGTIGPTDVVEQLRQSGVTVVYVENEPSPDGAAELARQTAAALGVPAAGASLATELAERIAATGRDVAALADRASSRPLRIAFLYLRGTSGVYYLLGEGTGADALATALGGVDVAAEIGWDGARPMTDEALVAADADVYLVMTGGLESVGGVDGLLEAKPAVGLTPAGEHRRFVDMADGQILSFGPRTPAVLDALARAVYAP